MDPLHEGSGVGVCPFTPISQKADTRSVLSPHHVALRSVCRYLTCAPKQAQLQTVSVEPGEEVKEVRVANCSDAGVFFHSRMDKSRGNSKLTHCARLRVCLRVTQPRPPLLWFHTQAGAADGIRLHGSRGPAGHQLSAAVSAPEQA